MRVIAGSAGGISIQVPVEATRPTTDRVREAIFSSLGAAVPGARVLDLFAGSGSVGIESLSRGADSAVFVDESQLACKVIRANLEKTRLAARGRVVFSRVDRYLDGLAVPESFDLVFADPPYARDEASRALLASLLAHEKLIRAIAAEGTFILESFSRESLPKMGGWTVVKEKIQGDTRVTFLRKS